MKYILIVNFLLLHISCNSNKTKERKNGFTANQEITIADSLVIKKDTLLLKVKQNLIIFNNSANDSLFGELNGGFKNDNYIPYCIGKPLKIIKSEDGVKFSLFLIAGKEDNNKVVLSKILNDTVYFKRYVYKEGRNQDPWFQEIRVFIADNTKKIKFIILEPDN